MANIGIQISTIELLSFTIKSPQDLSETVQLFKFKLNIEFIPSIEKKLVAVITSIDILDADLKNTFGNIVVSCIYKFENFDDVISTTPNGELELALNVRERLLQYSSSTTRGVMFSTFKGTFLHNAILPLL